MSKNLPPPPPPLDLVERIAALRSDIEQLVAEHVAAEAARCPGVPAVVIEKQLWTRVRGCHCDAATLLRVAP